MRSQSGLTIVSTHEFVHEAEITRAFLESEGLAAWVLDASQVGIAWHLAGPVGGVKVAVHPDDAERAMELLAPENIAPTPAPPLEPSACPRCGSTSTSEEHPLTLSPVRAAASFLLSWLLGILLAFRLRREEHRCLVCSHTWPS